jgi:hypothetical protein
MIPKAKHSPALALKIGVSGMVSRAFRVFETVRFDDQLSANAKKVDDIRSDRNLPAKLDPIQATITQKTPQAQLDVSRRASHCSSARALISGDAFVSLHRSSENGCPHPAALRASTFSPREKGSAAAVWCSLSHEGEWGSVAQFGPPLLPRGEGGAKRRMKVVARVASRLRKSPAFRRELLQ